MRSRFMVSAVLAAAVLGGCKKEDTTPTNPGGASTKPTTKAATTPVVTPPVIPTTVTPAVNSTLEDAAKKAAEAAKRLPTTGRVPTTAPAVN